MNHYKKIVKILILICLLLLIIKTIAHKPKEDYSTIIYTVEAGDAAWGICKKYNFAEKDVRELIRYIEADNNIKAGYLEIGQELIIRIYGDDISE